MFRLIALSYSRSPISIKNCAVCKEKVWLIDTQKKKKKQLVENVPEEAQEITRQSLQSTFNVLK